MCYWWAARPPSKHGALGIPGALAKLRASQREISCNIERKNRIVVDFDRNIMEIGLRWRAAGLARRGATGLSQVDRGALKHELGRKRLYLRSIERFYGLLRTIECQISQLEDVSTMQTSMQAMRSGVAAQEALTRPGGALYAPDVESILDRVAEQQQLAADMSDLVLAVNEEMSDMTAEDLEAELDRLMHSDEFTGQFDGADVARAQQAYVEAELAPPPPAADPLLEAMTNEAAHVAEAYVAAGGSGAAAAAVEQLVQ